MRTASLSKISSVLLLFACVSAFSQNADKDICNRVFAYAFEHAMTAKPPGDVMAEIGKRFIDSPYVANTLDEAGPEHLVVDLRGFDCVTLVENSLAFERCVKTDSMSFGAFQEKLQNIRYRGGVLNGYGSRLHYFSEWIRDNEKKHNLRDITRELGGVPYNKSIDFMMTHRDKYPKLAPDSVFQMIVNAEHNLAHDSLYYIPKEFVAQAEEKIQSGDIIAITTGIAGLDVSHTAIAVRLADGSLHLLHAPDVGERVTITKDSLSKYLEHHAKQTGIIVARPQ
jgi:hypothetical protein